jgi:hypothetical protein
MKKLALLIIIIIGINYAKATAPSIHSVNITELFVIEEGFDTNDNIEVTFYTQLPNACYKPYKHEVTKENNQFKLEFFIKQKELTGCERELTDLDFPINYTQTISLGEHEAGNYSILYKQTGVFQSKVFKIKQATSVTLDDRLYAPVSSAFIPELINPTQHAQVILTGIFNNSCMKLSNRDIEVSLQGNVFIILPKARLVKGNKCKQEQFALQSIVDLGEVVKEGHYLVHIRSQSGLSVNKVFHVKKGKIDTRGI